MCWKIGKKLDEKIQFKIIKRKLPQAWLLSKFYYLLKITLWSMFLMLIILSNCSTLYKYNIQFSFFFYWMNEIHIRMLLKFRKKKADKEEENPLR
jgi:hypothetical protein